MNAVREVLLVRATLAASMLLIFAAAASANAEPYQIQTNSPVHVTGTGNEVVLIYGDAPDARWVEITIGNATHEAAVHDGSFHLTVLAPAPGTYAVTGTWSAETVEPGGVTHATTGHLAGGMLTVLGRGYGDVPAGTVTVLPGAHLEGCEGCVSYTTDMVDAGGYVLVSNTDDGRHQFKTDSLWAVPSTGNLDPGESVRLPFNSEGGALYRCVYHPWLGFTVESTGMYTPEPGPGAIHVEAPPYAGESVRIGITHTGAAAMAHVIIIQNGQVLSADSVPLAGGYGMHVADSSEWRVGEVLVSVSAGADHATETISVRPPPGAAERSGRITGYDGVDGILISGGLARPVGLISLDAALDATRQVCRLGSDAVFRGDAGTGRGSHYVEGTVWCDGVNLGVYLLESGLAITDPAECGMAQSEWLTPYCRPEQGQQGRLHVPDATDGARDAAGGGDDAGMDGTDGTNSTNSMDSTDSMDSMDSENGTDGTEPDGGDGAAEDTIIIIPDAPAIPDAGGPEFETVDTCDHITDPECPCPDGWVRNGDWCDPDWYEGIDGAAGAAGDAVGAVSGAAEEAIAEGVGGARGTAVDAFSGFFDWLGEILMEIPRLFEALGQWVFDQWLRA